MKQSISAIILAAGTSSRMGRLKQILALGDSTILEHVIVKTLEERFSEIITVIGYEASTVKKAISVRDPRFRWVVNGGYGSGQSTSLKLGIENLPENDASFMVFLGDLPFISAATIHSIYASGKDRGKVTSEPFIIQPEYKGIAGHPVFFGNISNHFFSSLKGDRGAKSIMKKVKDHRRLAVDDRGILFDVDTPEDYVKAKRFFGA